jgi:hypothetical protein
MHVERHYKCRHLFEATLFSLPLDPLSLLALLSLAVDMVQVL